MINTGLRCDNKTGERLISWQEYRKRYCFQFTRKGEKKIMKRFKTLPEAIEYRDEFLKGRE
tara:strand:+ start:538 stop:720 length:183 start_codon:yes stop_codon:yes gene_type:complete